MPQSWDEPSLCFQTITVKLLTFTDTVAQTGQKELETQATVLEKTD